MILKEQNLSNKDYICELMEILNCTLWEEGKIILTAKDKIGALP